MRTDRKDRADRGVLAVETALILPVFFLLVLGIVEFGLAFKDQLAVTSSVRAGARMASAQPRIATYSTDAAVQIARAAGALDLTKVESMWIYKADTSGYPLGAGGTFNSCSSSCMTFSWSAAQHKFVQTGGSWPSTSQNACQGQQDTVGVYMKFRHDAVTGVFFSHISMSSHTVMVLEPIPNLQAGGCK